MQPGVGNAICDGQFALAEPPSPMLKLQDVAQLEAVSPTRLTAPHRRSSCLRYLELPSGPPFHPKILHVGGCPVCMIFYVTNVTDLLSTLHSVR